MQGSLSPPLSLATLPRFYASWLDDERAREREVVHVWQLEVEQLGDVAAAVVLGENVVEAGQGQGGDCGIVPRL